jgi:hypothetical protein
MIMRSAKHVLEEMIVVVHYYNVTRTDECSLDIPFLHICMLVEWVI